MTVLYDPQIFTWQRFGGISRYFVELIKNLDPGVDYRLPVCLSDNEYLQQTQITKVRWFFAGRNFRGKGRIIHTLNNWAFGRAARQGFDLVHPTYYDPYFLAAVGQKPLVVTVHDMIHELYAAQFAPKDRTSANKRLLCERADKIIAISHHTKADLVRLFGIAEEKIEVIYHGQSFEPTDARTMDLPDRYVLFTGGRGGYKNFVRFAEAFARLEGDLSLVCTGSSFSEFELEMLAQLGIADRTRVLYASDSQLAELYARAALFVFPSQYEGFGIPILEAFASRCPIALSNASSFPEVAGDAGGYFDPLDVESMRCAMQQILDDESLRNEMVEKGSRRLEQFSWQKMAHQTCALYRSLV